MFVENYIVSIRQEDVQSPVCNNVSGYVVGRCVTWKISLVYGSEGVTVAIQVKYLLWEDG